MRTIATTLLFLLTMALSGVAQCRVSVEAPDSLAFLLTINDNPVNQYPIVAVTFNSPASGKTNLKIEFPNKPTLGFTQIVNIKKGASVAYNIERSKGALKFVLSSETILTPEETATAAEEIYTTTADTMANPVVHNGCENLVEEQMFQDLIVLVDGQHFESKKLSVMTDFVSANCIRTDHLRYMMSKLSQEDNKLVLLQASKQHIYDRDNLPEAANEFFLARNKTKAIEIIAADR